MRSPKAQQVADRPLAYEYSWSYRGRPMIEGESFPYPRPRTSVQERIVQARRLRRRQMGRSLWRLWDWYQGRDAYYSYREMRNS